MANTWYRTGTVSVTNGSPTVTGSGTTLWLTQAVVGDIFVGPDNALYEITAVTNDTTITIKTMGGVAGYGGATLSNQAYAIIRYFTNVLPVSLASGLAALQAKYHVTLDEMIDWLSGTATATITDGAGIAHTVKTPAALEAKVTGKLTKSVAGSSAVTLSASEADNLLIALTGTITASINVILPVGPKIVLLDTTGVTFGGFTITVKTASGSGVDFTTGVRKVLTGDSTNIVSMETFNRGGGVLEFPTNDLLGSAAYSDVAGIQDRTSVGWDDLVSTISAAGVPAVAAPTMANFGAAGTLQRQEYSFANGDYVFCQPFHIGHDIKPGGNFYIHVHWSTNSTSTAVVDWELHVQRAKGHNQEAFGAPVVYTVSQAASGTAWKHMLTEMTTPLVLTEPDELILVTLKRSSATNANTVFALAVDLHYESDRHNTPNKIPSFY